jgi:hypothetical protein
MSGRADIAREANAAGRSSRRGGAPTLSEGSTLATLIVWLVWCDPNGAHDTSGDEDCDPHTIESAWESVAGMLD